MSAFLEMYHDSRNALISYKEQDSVKGILTFIMNRLVYAPSASTHANEQILDSLTEESLKNFFVGVDADAYSARSQLFNNLADLVI